jgi:hypothetical protein
MNRGSQANDKFKKVKKLNRNYQSVFLIGSVPALERECIRRLPAFLPADILWFRERFPFDY